MFASEAAPRPPDIPKNPPNNFSSLSAAMAGISLCNLANAVDSVTLKIILFMIKEINFVYEMTRTTPENPLFDES